MWFDDLPEGYLSLDESGTGEAITANYMRLIGAYFDDSADSVVSA